MEVTALRAALAEVCYGFYIPNFEDHMGNTEAKAQQLFEKFDHFNQDFKDRIALTTGEIRLLKKAHQETLKELGPEEYETRTGVNFSFGQRLLKDLDEQSKALQSDG